MPSLIFFVLCLVCTVTAQLTWTISIYVCDRSSSIHFVYIYIQQYGIVVQLWGPSGLYAKSMYISVFCGKLCTHVRIRWPIYYLCTLYLESKYTNNIYIT